MKTVLKFLSVAALGGVFLTACNYRPALKYCAHRVKSAECYSAPRVADKDLQRTAYSAADALLRGAAAHPMLEHGAIISSAVTPVDSLEHTSSYGRILAEQLADRFAQQGYAVVMRPVRWDSLARHERKELRELAGHEVAEIVSTGSYAVGSDTLYTSLKLVRLSDGLVLSAHSFKLPLGSNLRNMLD